MKTRGSEWRKWNFHVHTKGTNKNDQFTSSTLEDFFCVFFKSAYTNNIKAIGITDYFSIDRYLDALQYVSEIDKKINPVTQDKLFNDEEIKFIKKIFLFPNVELRMLPATDRGRLINIHCLFNPQYVKHLENDFFGHIENQDGKKMNRHGLIDYGQTLDSTLLSDQLRYKKGVDNFVIDLKTLKNLLAKNKEFQDNCILVVSNSNNDGASAVQKHYDLFENDNGSLDGLRTSIYKISHSIFSTNQKDINYFLGKRLEGTPGYNYEMYKNEVNDVIKKRGSLKSCIVGCDSHSEAELFKRFTWVKGELTFEGLRQICFEPEQRVKIQNDKPDFKEDKLVIDKVKFSSSNNIFTNEEIYLNENLNVIIGGKSSGKSILLYSIAKTLLPDNSILKNENGSEKYNLQLINPEFNFEIMTKSGISQKMFRDENENSIIPEIKYIPQNYLVKLAEPEINKQGKSLNKLVRDLINEDLESKTRYDQFIYQVKQNDSVRNGLVDSYFGILDEIKNLEIELKTKSSKDVLEKNIKSNSEKVEELNTKAGLSPEQIQEYKNIQEQIETNNLNAQNWKDDFSTFKQQISELKRFSKEIIDKKSSLIENLKTQTIKSHYEEKLKFIDDYSKNIVDFEKDTAIITAENGNQQLENESIFKDNLQIINNLKNDLKDLIKPFQKNEELKKQIDELNKSIATDKKLLTDIISLNKNISDKKIASAQSKIDLLALYKANYYEYIEIINQQKERTQQLENDGLKIEGIAQFNFPKFYKSIIDISDGRSASYLNYPILENSLKATFEIDYAEIEIQINQLFEDILNDIYVTTSKLSKKDIIKRILDDYFFDFWRITYKGDKLGEMSTGKASFVILMLIIGLSQSKAPILIDQPEDNLDNRSITSDLVFYLKNKKLERQIIIVTHNANIVVNSDAENVIIANQKGQNDIETSSIYKFDYINGAIENTLERIKTETDLLKSMGIREHIADIVEGGKDAFKLRELKYRFK